MATVKFSDEMPKPTSIKGTDRFLISDGVTGEAKAPDFNQAKEYLNITGIELEPLVGGDSSATALVVANGPAGEQRTAEVSSGKWYDFGSGPVEASADRRWKSYWSGTAWSLKDMGALLQQTGVDTINPTGDALPKEKAVAKYVDPLSAMINGGDVVFGDIDFSSYTTNNTQEYLFLHRAFPVNVQGNVIEVKAEFHRGGTYNIYIARPVPGQPQRFTMLGKTPKTATAGTNTVTLDIDALPGDLLAIGQVSGGALVKTKVGTNGLWLNTTSSNADVANGTEVAFSSSGRIMAVNFKVRIGGIQGEVENVNNRVDGVEDQVASSVKKSDVKTERSTNMFDPSKIVSGKYVSSNGNIASVAGWEFIPIDFSESEPETEITLNGFDTASVASF